MSTRTTNSARSATRMWFVLGTLVVVLLGLALWTGSGSTPEGGEVTVGGEPLPPYDSNLPTDPAVGMTAPTILGTDLDGNPVELVSQGRPTVVVVVAHWCPVCQREIPRIQGELMRSGIPDGVEIVTVATSNMPTRPNYPAATWLERENWHYDTLLDDGANTAGQALGVTAYPATIWLDADEKVVLRTAGEIRDGAFTQMLTALAEGS